jgi:hypothetical protein
MLNLTTILFVSFFPQLYLFLLFNDFINIFLDEILFFVLNKIYKLKNKNKNKKCQKFF